MKKLTMPLFATTLLLAASGCSLLGNQAKPITGLESTIYSVSNAVMDQVIQRTNYVTQTITNQVVETHTNQVGIMVLVTNLVPIETHVPVIVFETNKIEVPQLAPGTGGSAITAGGSALGSIWGFGGLAGIILSGGLNWYQKMRNNALAATALNSNVQATVMKQVAGTLTQQIETVVEVIKGTPQGQPLATVVKDWLASHQREAGVITEVTGLVADNVDNDEAKKLASTIADKLKTLRSA